MVQRRALVIDAVVTAVMLGLGIAVVQANVDIGPGVPWVTYPRWPASIAALAATVGPVAVRSRWPLAALAVSTAGLAATRLLHVPETSVTSIALFLCLYSAGRWGTSPMRTWVRTGSVATLLGVLLWSVLQEREFLTAEVIPSRAYYLLSLAGISANFAYFALAWLLGDFSRTRAEREHELAQRTVELEREREENARRAVIDERVRIARELHDVVAHHVSLMGIQAAAARRVGTQQPEQVVQSLEAIEQSSREAVTELHRLLGFLRNGSTSTRPESTGGATRAAIGDDVPRPGLANLETMRRQLAEAGLALSLRIVGDRRDLTPAVDLSAYRILQESLTNVVKHAGVDQASVTVSYGEDRLQLRVADDGRGQQAVMPGAGAGIVGMQERAALVGGSLSAGPRPGRGFEVVADLPYDRPPLAASRPVAVSA